MKMENPDSPTKDDVRWALHWPRRDYTVPDDVLKKYPDMQKVDKQINFVADSITIHDDKAIIHTGNEEKMFSLIDFPMRDRIAQREFVRQCGLQHTEIEDVSIGKKSWEVFDAKEIGVIGIHKKLLEVLNDEHNFYMDEAYRNLDRGDLVQYLIGEKAVEVEVVYHAGAHLMKYYSDDGTWIPILPSRFISKIGEKIQRVEVIPQSEPRIEQLTLF